MGADLYRSGETFELTMRIGIDLGGTKIEGILMDCEGHVTEVIRRAAPREQYDQTVQAISELVRELDDEAGIKCPVGIGTPGAWISDQSVMKNCNSTWLNGRPLLDDLIESLSRPVRIANDADCFALSEAVAGAGRECQCVFGIILGTGVGGGWVMNGRLRVGPNRLSGEWGHTPLPYFRSDRHTTSAEADLPDRECYCGRINCVETFLSGPGFSLTHRLLTGENRQADTVAGSEFGERSYALYTSMLARTLAQIINVIDPDIIVCGGGISNSNYLYRDLPVKVAEYTFNSEATTRIVPAEHGDASGVRGAAWLNPA